MKWSKFGKGNGAYYLAHIPHMGLWNIARSSDGVWQVSYSRDMPGFLAFCAKTYSPNCNGCFPNVRAAKAAVDDYLKAEGLAEVERKGWWQAVADRDEAERQKALAILDGYEAKFREQGLIV
jgi:hypothetical protein